MKIDKGSLMIGISIGVLIAFLVLMVVVPFYNTNTYSKHEITGYFSGYVKNEAWMNGVLQYSDGYFFHIENASIITTNYPDFRTYFNQEEIYFKDIFYPVGIIDMFVGKNITIKFIQNNAFEQKIESINVVEG